MRYFMGLDMGTSSVGWAVTDEHYQLLRRKGKDRMSYEVTGGLANQTLYSASKANITRTLLSGQRV